MRSTSASRISWLRSLWRQLQGVRYPLTIAVSSTAITFVFGFCAYLVIENHLPPEGFWGIWNRWDAVHYLNVAESGYGGEASGEERFMIVFLPAYPGLIYLARLLIPDWHAAGLVVSNLCAAGAFCFCFLLTEKEMGCRAARGAVFYLSIFPTAYFFHVAYSETCWRRGAAFRVWRSCCRSRSNIFSKRISDGARSAGTARSWP
jgi:hypothetical protein